MLHVEAYFSSNTVFTIFTEGIDVNAAEKAVLVNNINAGENDKVLGVRFTTE